MPKLILKRKNIGVFIGLLFLIAFMHWIVLPIPIGKIRLINQLFPNGQKQAFIYNSLKKNFNITDSLLIMGGKECKEDINKCLFSSLMVIYYGEHNDSNNNIKLSLSKHLLQSYYLPSGISYLDTLKLLSLVHSYILNDSLLSNSTFLNILNESPLNKGDSIFCSFVDKIKYIINYETPTVENHLNTIGSNSSNSIKIDTVINDSIKNVANNRTNKPDKKDKKSKEKAVYIYNGEFGDINKRDVAVNKRKENIQISKRHKEKLKDEQFGYLLGMVLKSKLQKYNIHVNPNISIDTKGSYEKKVKINFEVKIEDLFIHNLIKLEKDITSIKREISLVKSIIKEYEKDKNNEAITLKKEELENLENVIISKNKHYENLHYELIERLFKSFADDNKLRYKNLKTYRDDKKNRSLYLEISIEFTPNSESSYNNKYIERLALTLFETIENFTAVNNLDYTKLNYSSSHIMVQFPN